MEEKRKITVLRLNFLRNIITREKKNILEAIYAGYSVNSGNGFIQKY
jgi:hypothetical protein